MKFDSNKREIIFEKFDCLDKEESLVAKKIVEKYVQKIEKITTVQQVKVKIRTHSKIKSKNFEVRARVEYSEGTALLSHQDMNPFVAIDSVMSKMYEEVKHRAKKK